MPVSSVKKFSNDGVYVLLRKKNNSYKSNRKQTNLRKRTDIAKAIDNRRTKSR